MIALIAGILRLDGHHADPDIVARMLGQMSTDGLPTRQVMESRGPFAAGVLHLNPRGAVPPSEPRISADGNTILAADLRLFDPPGNALEFLASDLQSHGSLASRQLHGDFAYAFWDGARLILSRDPFGVRPLQYTIQEGQYVAFASTPGALLNTGLAERVLDAETLHGFPIAAAAIEPRTFIRDIQSVPSAHSMTIGLRGERKLERYWRLPIGPLFRADESPSKLTTELHHLLDQAVRRRLPHQGSGAGHLSGGLDSGSISALAARALAESGRSYHAFCFTERSDDPNLRILDELPYAVSIAEQAANIDLHEISTPDQITLMQQLDPDLGFSVHPEEPEEQILRIAAEQGATTLLSGWGGDEVVTWRGHSNVAELFWTGQWRVMWRAISRNAQESNRSPFSIFRKAVLSESLPRPLRDWIRSRHGNSSPSWIDTIAAMVPPEGRAALHAVPERAYAADTRLQRRGALEHWSLPSQLETFAQRGARHGMAYAYPMLDLDLLAFAVRIPAVLLKADGSNRAIFREAMQDVLPDKVRLKNLKLTPYPAETLRQAHQKSHMLDELERMKQNPLVSRFVDIDGLSRYISDIQEPDEVRDWMNEAADAGEQVVQREIYHVFVVWLAWYLDQHGTETG